MTLSVTIERDETGMLVVECAGVAKSRPGRVCQRGAHTVCSRSVSAAVVQSRVVRCTLENLSALARSAGQGRSPARVAGCVSQGRTEAEAMANIREAIVGCLEVRAEQGLPLTVRTLEVEVAVA